MTFNEFVIAIEQIVPPDECYSVDVVFWRYEDGRKQLNWHFWSGEHKRSIERATPEAYIEAVRHLYETEITAEPEIVGAPSLEAIQGA